MSESPATKSKSRTTSACILARRKAAEDPSRDGIRNTTMREEALSSHPRAPGGIIGATGGGACLNLASGGLQDGGDDDGRGDDDDEVMIMLMVEGWR